MNIRINYLDPRQFLVVQRVCVRLFDNHFLGSIPLDPPNNVIYNMLIENFPTIEARSNTLEIVFRDICKYFSERLLSNFIKTMIEDYDIYYLLERANALGNQSGSASLIPDSELLDVLVAHASVIETMLDLNYSYDTHHVPEDWDSYNLLVLNHWRHLLQHLNLPPAI